MFEYSCHCGAPRLVGKLRKQDVGLRPLFVDNTGHSLHSSHCDFDKGPVTSAAISSDDTFSKQSSQICVRSNFIHYSRNNIAC
ncbi:hypothetical protein CB1_000636005 [Camelus ferus]|nr:hypothetical protein CB1_000636005 [Camelus ferus]